MSVTKPIMRSQIAFDKNDGNIFYFTTSGGSQVVKNRLTIYNSSTSSIVYQEDISTFKFEHALPTDNDLVNGVSYNAYINTYDIDDNISEDSIAIQFYCYTTPELSITNIPSSGKISSSSISLNIRYEQIEDELLSSLAVYLYDASNSLLYTSDKLYSTETPELFIESAISGLTDGEIYKIQVSGSTINGTLTNSDIYEIYVEYSTPTIFSSLNLENNCQDGYIIIKSNIISVEGETNETPIYIDSEILDLSNDGDYCSFTEGFSVSKDFTIGIWMIPTQINNFCSLLKDNNNKFKLEFVREYPYNGSDIVDCLALTGVENNEVVVYQRSDSVELMNNNSKILVWVQKVDNQYTLTLDVMYREENEVVWDEPSNVEYNYITDLRYEDEDFTEQSQYIAMANDIDIYPIEDLYLYEGKYDHLYLTQNNTIAINEEKPLQADWDFDTRLIVDFNGDLKGGNTDYAVSEISSIKIKRRAYGDFEWIQLYQVDIVTIDDFNIFKVDSYVPNLEEFEYAIIPVLADGAEGEYIVESIYSSFNGAYITDATQTFKFISNVESSISRNVSKSSLQPIGSRTPFFIRNSDVNYDKGSFSGKVLGEFENNRVVSRKEIVQQSNDLLDFLTDGNVKILKDWNGNIWMCEIEDGISIQNDMKNGTIDVSFNFTEQGKYNIQSDLEDYGFVEVY